MEIYLIGEEADRQVAEGLDLGFFITPVDYAQLTRAFGPQTYRFKKFLAVNLGDSNVLTLQEYFDEHRVAEDYVQCELWDAPGEIKGENPPDIVICEIGERGRDAVRFAKELRNYAGVFR